MKNYKMFRELYANLNYECCYQYGNKGKVNSQNGVTF